MSAPSMYFGSDENLAGETAGERIDEAGGKHTLCVIQAAGSVALEARCAGVKSKSPNTENIQVEGKDDSAVVSSLQAKLSQDKSIDYIVTLGAPIAQDALKAKDAAGSKAKIVTFDLSPDAAQAIKDGDIEFSIDQQPYVQGYQAVTALYLNLKNGNDIGGGGPVLTGPSFVDKDEHRRHPSVRPEGHTLGAPAEGRPADGRRPPRQRNPEILMSQTQEKKHVQDAPSEKSNRVQIGLLSRALARPEIGALVAAVVIGIFFLVVAPPFRSTEALSTVLYQSATIGIVAVAVGMLMIGGEFDLSAGVMVTTAGLFAAMFSYQYNLNLWIGCAAVAGRRAGHRVPQRVSW